jgi:hypothetical protein
MFYRLAATHPVAGLFPGAWGKWMDLHSPELPAVFRLVSNKVFQP